MKIEKLNENKIRITLNLEDLNERDIDFHSFMSNSIESQSIFLDMLDKADREVGFNTDDCRIMIEALALKDRELYFDYNQIRT
ncbi:MAG: adaptor protein MecA [Clostridia bacterium]|nr:adaptor protein MecA [Clostridia bacterium]MCI9274626.1 adaptor protein MecA [Clostridia bacterium]